MQKPSKQINKIHQMFHVRKTSSFTGNALFKIGTQTCLCRRTFLIMRLLFQMQAEILYLFNIKPARRAVSSC